MRTHRHLRHRGVTRRLFFSLVLAVSLCRLAEADYRIDNIFDAQRQRLLAVSNGVEFQATNTLTRFSDSTSRTLPNVKLAPSARDMLSSPTQQTSFHFWGSGEKYRTDWNMTIDQGVLAESRSNIYNGSQYLVYDANQKMGRGYAHSPDSVLPYGKNLPILAPYGFVWANTGKTPTMQELASQSTWNALAECSQIVDKREVAGVEAVVMDIAVPDRMVEGARITFRLSCAPSLDFYPVQCDYLKNGELYERVTATDIQSITTGSGTRAYVHAHCVTEHWNWKKPDELVSREESALDLAKLSIESKIPDEVFQLPREMLSYYDTTDKTKNYDFSKEGIGRWEAKNVKNLAQQSSPAQNDQQLASTGKSMAGENKDTGSGAVHGRGYAKGLIAALFIASGALGGGWFVWKRARGQK